jgi:DNA processing protein
MTGACDACLRRSHLVGLLAPRIAGALASETHPRGLLTLDEGDLIRSVAGRGTPEAHRFLERFDASAARARVQAADVWATCRHDPEYPDSLTALHDPPVVLYFTGGPERLGRLLEQPAVAIVGTRRPSPYGIEVAYELGRGLGAAGVTVVSGLALGIDSHAHRGATDARGGAVAVLACGPDVVYPRRHRRLYERVRHTGAIVSELPPGTRPFRWSFPARNRIMAGLARMTVVVEAGHPSGSLITTGYAEDLGRDVGAVPGPITTWRADGTNKLLKDGASPICGPEDVLDALFGVGHGRLRAEAEPELEPELRRVLDEVEQGRGPEGICEATGLAPGAVRAALVQLELRGLVVRDRFGGYQRAVGATSGSLVP